MKDPVHPDMGAMDEVRGDPANDNDRCNGPCMLTIAGLLALGVVALAGLSPLLLIWVL